MEQVIRNEAFDLAVNFVNQTHCNLFITGKAGTGKTTFLRHIKQMSTKRNVVVAPTGIAAINAGGVTIHSFFQIPPGLFLPDHQFFAGKSSEQKLNNKHTLLQGMRLGREKRKIIYELELLIIDEVSMVKADLMDAIDTVLRHIRRKYDLPFGGVQVLCIGDLFQLPPVIKDAERALFHTYYESAFFFASKVFSQTQMVSIEFDKIYRQSNSEFIATLNKIRNATIDFEEVAELNKKFYKPIFEPQTDENYITLCSHNYKADQINQDELDLLAGSEYVFKAKIEGEFYENSYPVPVELKLKVGAQIMFIKNDQSGERRFFNGKLGRVAKIEAGEIFVEFENDKDLLQLEKMDWQNIRYSFNDKDKKIDENVLGSFTQYPIKLAWAVTIHKSQGLTFDKAIVDAGSSFSDGQVYVALSRLTGPDGLVLKTQIPQTAISCNPQVQHFMQSIHKLGDLPPVLNEHRKLYLQSLVKQSFDMQKLEDLALDFKLSIEEMKVPDRVLTERSLKKWFAQIAELNKVSQKFSMSLKKLLPEIESGKFDKLLERLEAATQYFSEEINQKLIAEIDAYKKAIVSEKLTKKFRVIFTRFDLDVRQKLVDMRSALQMVKNLSEGQEIGTVLSTYNKETEDKQVQESTENSSADRPKRGKKEKGETQRISLEMFNAGKSVDEIAKERGYVVTTIQNHLAVFVKTGELSILKLMEKDRVMDALQRLKDKEYDGLAEAREFTGDSYSFPELRMIVNYREYLETLKAQTE